MKFFSKLTFICNGCFLASVVFWYIEVYNKRQTGKDYRLIELPWAENILVILGYGAIIINLFFLLIIFIYTAFKIKHRIPRWMIFFSVIMFACQVFFHFFFKKPYDT